MYIRTRDGEAEPSLDLTEHVLKALAHRSRLLIVQTIGRGEACVTDLQQVVGSDMSTVSKHLTVLKSAGVVEDRKAGLQVFYRLRIPCIADFVHCIGSVMAGLPVTLPQELLPGRCDGQTPSD
ncbi:MAG: metalloregulator ArsR/SmtB family transcription factor [Capsulimonadaceae bacterium]|nr:metalloregulator ArsR/SmtB family transcription factor [Capsulimonadaceae bacterium]